MDPPKLRAQLGSDGPVVEFSLGSPLFHWDDELLQLVQWLYTSIELPMVIDADGLNNLAGVDEWWKTLGVSCVVTPHPGELSRLGHVTVDEIQSDRLGTARRLAAEWSVTLVLKGANTIVAHPDGRVAISPFANPGLASGGTGDVLAGMIAGLIAQGVEPFDAASLGVYLHGRAAEHVSGDLGDAGMLASDLLPTVPRVIKELKGGSA
ncbi:MAG: NAD(P)H-hydrate dehydratase [Chloroflexi bacterium]|nr:NAD(P)H-hydrate dehydratase [Chloroflexota bacterium]